MSLPEPWVETIFAKMTLVYGHQFLSRWDGLELADVKADWAHELSRFQQNFGAISYGLQNLPAGHPPTVLEFRAICSRRPDEPTNLIDRDPTPCPDRVKRELAKLVEPVSDEPERVKWARHFIRIWGHVRKLNPRRAETLIEAQGIVAAHEADLARKAKQREVSHAG